MTTKDATYRPRAVDYSSNANWHSPDKRIRRSRVGVPGRRPVQKVGAIPRVTGATRRTSVLADRRLPIGKIAAGLLFAAGGILVTTASTGTVSRAPELSRVAETVLPPDFFFDDQASALDERALSHELQHARPITQPAGDEPTDASGSGSLAVDVAVAPAMTQANHPVGISGQSLEHVSIADQTGAPLVLEGALEPAMLPASGELNERKARAPVAAPVNSTERTGLVDERIDTPSEASGSNLAMLEESSVTAPSPTTTRLTVAAGDTLSELLHANGVSGAELAQLMDHDVIAQELSRLRVGQGFAIERDATGALQSLSSRASADRRITIARQGSTFAVDAIDLPLEKERVVTSGTIQQSLYLAAAEADLKQSTIMELADIFQWELDFARDIRQGDHFSIVYDRLFREGQYIGDGDILAAEFVRGGKTYQAIRFTTEDGKSAYYTPSGDSKRRTFLRHPVDVVRITSKFDPNRLHPVLHQIRAHRGVDYGAPHGSPIRATADGTVAKAAPYGAYGNTVILKHGRNKSTLYAHMSRISDKSIVGKRVSQGDVIGYVGRTGRVTGTHLHYEYRIDGKHVDPLTVELPAAEPIAPQYRAALRAVSAEMIAQMQSVLPKADERVASAEPVTSVLPRSN